MRKQAGIILLTTAIILLVLTLLVGSLLQAIRLYSKINNQLALKNEAFYALEAIALKLPLENNEQCIRFEQDPNRAIELLPDHHCQWVDKQKTYDYMISDLGAYPCLIGRFNKKETSSHHWLVTIKSSQGILQLRIATPERAIPCKLNKREIGMGILSWRYVK